MLKPRLYLHVAGATHFLRWERPEFAKYFQLTGAPADDVALLAFGPDALESAAALPASKRFAVLFPGFGFNPTHNLKQRAHQTKIIGEKFDTIFISHGPLQIAYAGLANVELYPFGIDADRIGFRNYRRRITNLVHVSSDAAQKDWRRSEDIMRLTGMPFEVYPPRDREFYQRAIDDNARSNRLRRLVGLKQLPAVPRGYVPHHKVIGKYKDHDGFVHVAGDVKHLLLLDGKYTASLLEAGATGAILFWHDTFALGNDMETAFDLPLEPEKAARQILDIAAGIDVPRHSRRTREEVLEKYNVRDSVGIRARSILAKIG